MHLEALKLEQKKVFEKLKKFPEFYLTGGTALALQIGHRISVDFDLFSGEDIPRGLLPKVKRVFENKEIKVIVNHSEQLTVEVERVRIDFVKYKYPLVLKLIEFEGIKILPIAEIAAMKAYTLNYRGTVKDYIDLYFILKERYVTLKEIEDMGEKKYKNDFNFRLFLEQLINLEDIKKEEEKKIEFLKEKITKEKMERFFENEVGKIKI